MIGATQVAVALAAVVEALRASIVSAPLGPDGQALLVIDGPPRVIDDPDLLIVGFSASAPDVQVSQQLDDFDGGRTERLTIACLSSSRRGEHDPEWMAVVRAQAVAIVDWAAQVLAADPELGGAVGRAEIGFVSALDQSVHEDGTDATIEFAIIVETF